MLSLSRTGGERAAQIHHVAAIAAVGSVLALIWIPIYATLAFRRVYGDSVGATIAKELGIGAIYAVVSGLGFVITIYWVSIAT